MPPTESLVLNAAPAPQPDHRDRIIKSLEEDNRDLLEQVNQARRELESQRSETTRAVAELRRQLSPLYQAMRAVFGEIDAIIQPGVDTPPVTPEVNNKKAAVWQSWINKLGGKQSALIEALLEHGRMTTAQIRVAIHCGQQTVYDTTFKLKKLGLIEQGEGKYWLKEI